MSKAWISVLCEMSVGDYVWRVLSSGVAIGIYVGIIITAIVLAVIFMLKGEKELSLLNEKIEDSADRRRLINEYQEMLDKKKLEEEENAVKSADEDEETRRFSKLNEIDESNLSRARIKFNDRITLEELCIRFRNYAASARGLYYDESQIRQYIAGMGVSKIIIMQGMSGTGKTSLAVAFGRFLNNPSLVVPVQPMWKERTDLIGYYNEFTKKFNVTDLLEEMYKANYSSDIYTTVLDEMNIARVEYYFAEFLSLLEIPDVQSRRLTVVPDVWQDDPKQFANGQIMLPDNMWFIGTANNDDSTFAIADKVYDRAMIMNLDKKAKPFEAPKTKPIKLSVHHWNELVTQALKDYTMTERNRQRIKLLDAYMIKTFHVSFGNRIMKQIERYVPLMLACGGSELEAIDDIIAKKILRKLEACNPILVKNSSPDLQKYLDELFGKDAMLSCKEFLHHLERMA